MGRPKVSDEHKHQIPVSVYMNELEKEEFTNKIASDPQNKKESTLLNYYH